MGPGMKAATPLAVATMTLARTAREEERLAHALQLLAAHRVPVYVTDGGSPESFIARLRDIDGVVLGTDRGLVRQVKRGADHESATHPVHRA
jgi:NAD(P)H-dependent flavin oxidoreductase YrpB (nitropropane dioxygenase family)